ncbi:delta(3,5)-Delta(2,4)-dienoyl-CoA isomerase, mitochondrial isoform X2 [Phalacrocorax aristotelis]|uniref:delta(3,5)-Delta(2,4)-dienoyl-CoA isomerase, mitochondrial isoform X2 n=1 Tax=Phalacrocorax aristotelis TaxID=126867 RepID=UPI003F4B1508
MAAGLRGLLGRPLRVPARLMAAEAAERRSPGRSFETLRVTQERDRVLHVELHRPEKRNAMNVAFWREMVECFQDISRDSSCHAVVVSGAGKIFTAGESWAWVPLPGPPRPGEGGSGGFWLI